MAGRLDLEDLREIIEAYQAGVCAEVTRYGGFVAKYMGDGVLVYFGYPQAHEDDAERAVRSGLSLLAAVPALCPHDEVLQVRVGIATGEVVVGNLIGAGSSQEQAVVGETPNLAARLQNLAGPGQVVIAQETRRLVGNLFQMTELGVVEVKGFTAPVCAWRVTDESRTESRFEAFHSGELTPLVGRRDELDLIRRRWAQARTGEGQAVLLSGEAGLGKSRLVVATEEMLAGEAPLRLRYFCSPHHQDIALFPVIQRLERAAKFEREDDGPARLDKLRALLAPETDAEDFALMAELLSAPTEGLTLPQGLSPQKKRERLLTALIHQLEALARTAPVLIIWEDVHWIDPFSRDLINLTLDRILQLPILMLVTFRPEFQASWIGREHVTMLALKRLSRRERNEMVGWLTGGKSLPAEVHEQIVERTDGVPLFLEELTNSILESGIVREEDAHFVLSGALPTLAIPTTLQGSLMARLDRLAPLGEVAQIGAAIGREFSFELLAAVSGQSEEVLRQALEQLTSAELVFARGNPPEVSYTFKHALVQDAAYATLLKSRRQELHGTIARVLEERFPEMVERQPAVLAHHFEQAGLLDHSVEYRLKAGQRAFERWSMEEAITQIQKGLHLAPMLPKGRERSRKELDLLLILGKALIATKGYSSLESRGAYDRARVLCEDLNESTTLMAVLNRLGAHSVMRGDLDVALKGGVQLFERAQCDGSSRALAIAHARMSLILGPMGRLRQARTHATEALKLFGASAGIQDTFSANALVDIEPTVSAMLAVTLCCLGHPDEALELSESMIAEAQEKPNDAALAQGLWHLCRVYVLRRDIAGTLKISNHVTSLSNAKGLDWGSTSIILAGWARAQRGPAHDVK
ncbi:AAA family ATPase [Microvirga sp. BT689]|uniref:ATP-binding protein n=1 Tax=Microvirga arvi TaxID=2778731 RepID=UPI001950C673|nr:adenylate/guanylate cyclase domain-containing protein [Microvirga arvi]MBM6584403.1 AAA family ATPase [Microvirga arvi]